MPFADPALWTSGYGCLQNILYKDDDGSAVLAIALVAASGYRVNLYRFNMVAYASAFHNDPVIDDIAIDNVRSGQQVVPARPPWARLARTGALDAPSTFLAAVWPD